jgi:hypothetical protein
MSEIKAGDLVMVVRGCCGRYPHLGKVFTVASLKRVGSFSRLCCKQAQPESWRAVMVERKDLHATPLSYLVKIDPPALPENTNNKEEIHAWSG